MILAVVQVVYAAARFWESGTRCVLNIEAEAGALLVHEGVEYHFQEKTSDSYVLRLIDVPPRSQADTGSRQSPTTRGYVSCGDKRMLGNAMERGA